MIWIVSKSVIKTEDELLKRHEYIFDITQAKTSKWQNAVCFVKNDRGEKTTDIKYYRCQSHKGEYGIVITAHIDEVSSILALELSKRKKAYVAINSCKISNIQKDAVVATVKRINSNSEVFFAMQEEIEMSNMIYEINPIDDVGTFGFETTKSERELFRKRGLGLMKALREAYERVA